MEYLDLCGSLGLALASRVQGRHLCACNLAWLTHVQIGGVCVVPAVADSSERHRPDDTRYIGPHGAGQRGDSQGGERDTECKSKCPRDHLQPHLGSRSTLTSLLDELIRVSVLWKSLAQKQLWL